MSKSRKELVEENDDLVSMLNNMASTVEAEGRPFNEEEINRSESGYERVQEIKTELEQIDRLNKIKGLTKRGMGVEVHEPHSNGWTKKKEALAFKAWALNQSDRGDLIRSEMRQAAYDLGVNLTNPEYVMRDQSLTNAEGGYTTQQAVYSGLEKTIKYFGGIAGVCDYKTVSKGTSGNWSTIDDTANVAAAVSEKAGAANTDIVVGTIPYQFYKIGSGAFPVSNELLEDSEENWDEIVNEVLGERIGRKLNLHCTTGNLTNSKGFMLETTEGKAAADDTTFTYLELLDLFRSVDKAYRDNPNCAFFMNDATAGYVSKMVDDIGRPIFQDSYMNGGELRIQGKPVIICNNMADIAADAKPVAFGDPSKFKLRVVGTPTIKRLNEIAADDDSVVFLTHLRLASRLVQPNALKHLVMHS